MEWHRCLYTDIYIGLGVLWLHGEDVYHSLPTCPGACPGALSVPLLPYFTVFVAAAGLLGTLAPPSGAAAPQIQGRDRYA